MSIITSYYESESGFTNSLSTLLDGVDEFGSVGKTTALEFTGSFHWSTWVYFNNVSKNEFIVDTTLSPSSGNGYSFRLTPSNKIRWFNYSATGGQFVDSATTILVNTWYHIVCVHNTATAKNHIYINGALDATNTSTAATVTSDTTNLRIGDSIQFSGLLLDGYIDEVSAWGYAPTLTEVQEIYNSGKPADLTLHSQAANLTEWWRCGDNDTHPTWTGQKAVRDVTLVNTEAGDFQSFVP